MNKMSFILATVTFVLLGIPLNTLGEANQQSKPAETNGLPAKLRSLHDLDLIVQTKNIAAIDKTEVLLRWLVSERRDPTPTRAGASGGPVDSNYIQVQIAQTMAGEADLRALKWLSTSERLTSGAIRRILYVSMNDVVDKRCRDSLLDTLITDPNPYMREQAAIRLDVWAGDKVEGALRRALSDPFSVTYVSAHGGPKHGEGPFTYWPVRRAAEEALRNMKERSPSGERWLENWKRVFARRIEGYESFVSLNGARLERLLGIANSDRPARHVK